jgi:hypothetical protein
VKTTENYVILSNDKAPFIRTPFLRLQWKQIPMSLCCTARRAGFFSLVFRENNRHHIAL